MPDQERLHALDAVRGFALLLGIALHATVPFYPGLQRGIWAAVDSSPSLVLEDLGLFVHMFRMILFFFIAGFFARFLLNKRGVRDFWDNRRQRILYPFLLGVLVVVPITAVIFAVGIFRDAVAGGPPPGPPSLPAGFFPLMHLWFLYYLMLFYAALLLLRAAVHTIDRGGLLRTTLDSAVSGCLRAGVASILLALPVLWTLLGMPKWSYYAGIPTPDNSLIPAVPACVGYGTAMIFGWLVQRQPGSLQLIQRRWPVYLGIALAATVVCFVLLGTQVPDNQVPPGSRVFYALAYEVAGWSWVLAITGAALTHFAGYSPARRYLADASYWMYLVHLPVVAGIAVVIAHWPLSWMIKYPLTLALALSLLLTSYHYLVRPGWIGKLLNGRRYPIGKSRALPQPPAATA
jgi:peptidoglycan/LPS O-acetylase OafA/YrhL